MRSIVLFNSYHILLVVLIYFNYYILRTLSFVTSFSSYKIAIGTLFASNEYLNEILKFLREHHYKRINKYICVPCGVISVPNR